MTPHTAQKNELLVALNLLVNVSNVLSSEPTPMHINYAESVPN